MSGFCIRGLLNGVSPLYIKSQKKASAEIRGEFFRTKSWVNSSGDFLVDVSGPFSLEKAGGQNPLNNPRHPLHQNLGVPRPKPTPQGPGLNQVVKWKHRKTTGKKTSKREKEERWKKWKKTEGMEESEATPFGRSLLRNPDLGSWRTYQEIVHRGNSALVMGVFVEVNFLAKPRLLLR